MATKRQAPDAAAAGDHHTSKRPRYTNPNKPTNLSGKKSFKKAHPVNELKSQIRSLKRLLERQDSSLPANIRIEKERALKTATKDLENAVKAKKKSDVIGRWHKVRFFDRQKAERRLRKARKEGKGDEVVRDMEVDVNYAIYFPLERDYVSLFPRKEKEEGVVVEREGDREMWELVRKCMVEGTLQDLREGRLMVEKEDEEEEEEETARETNGKGKAKVKRKDEEEVGESEDSDDEAGGAFFGDD